MPGFTTHYLFGVRMYHKLTDTEIKKMLKRNLGPFRFGMQGPDLFFYNPFYIFGPEERNIGSLMHETEVNNFFRNYLTQAERLKRREDREAALSYFYGFLCHYALDTAIHPYVYYRSGYEVNKEKGKKESFSLHTYIEALMDTILLKEHLNLTPSRFHQTRTLTLSKREFHLLSSLLVRSVNKTYFQLEGNELPEKLEKRFSLFLSILSIKIGTWLLHDKVGLKKKLIQFFEEKFIKEVVVGNIIESDFYFDNIDANNMKKTVWYNPWDTSISSTATVPELFDAAGETFTEYAVFLNDYMKEALSENCNKGVRRQKKELLLKKLGNLSYHSGLSCD